MSNNPPYSILYLDEVEHKYLAQLLTAGGKVADAAMRDVASMSSTDPRANARSLLIMAATADIVMAKTLSEKLDTAKGEK